MCASVWFEFFGNLFYFQFPWFIGGERDKKEWDLNCENPFSRVSWYKRKSDIKKIEFMEFRVYILKIC